MQPNFEQDDRITRYLLGDLTESEQLGLEDEYFSDPEKFEAVWAAENHLVDRYVRGRLSDQERDLFERHYLKSPKHQQRVLTARRLLKAADGDLKGGSERSPEADYGQKVAVTASTKSSWWGRMRETMQISQLFPVGAMAGALLLLAFVAGWLLVERSGLKNQLAQIQSAEKTRSQREEELNRQLAAQREENDKLKSEMEQLRLALQQDRRPEQSPSPLPKPRSIFSTILSPMLIRGSREPKQLIIPRETDLIHLQMKVDQDIPNSLLAAIRTVEGKTFLTLPANKARIDNNQVTAVSINVPADKLPTGDYILTLSAKSNGQLEELNRYFFRIIKL